MTDQLIARCGAEPWRSGSEDCLVESKHVRDPDRAKRSFRSIERVNETLAKPVKVDANGSPKWDPLVDGMYRSDESELRRYRSAMANPAHPTGSR